MAEKSADSYRPLVIAGVLMALVFVLYIAGRILIPIAMGVLLAFVLNPAVAYLQARGMRRFHASLIVVFTSLAIFLGLMTALMLQMRDLAQELPDKKEQIVQKIRDVLHKGDKPGLFDRLNDLFTDLGKEVEKAADGPIPKKPTFVVPVKVQNEPTNNFSYLSILVGPLTRTLGAISLTIGLTISILVMREDLRNRFFILLGDGHVTSSTRALDDVSRRISGYLLTQVMLNTAFGGVFGVSLYFLGVPYALVWGVLAAVLRFVPYVGTWLAAVFPVLVSLAGEGWLIPAVVLALAVVLGLLANSVIEPMLTSRSTGVTPIALVVSTAFWTWLWGPIGLVLATPMTVCLSVLGKYVPSLRFLDILLGQSAPMSADLKFYQRLVAHDEIEASDLVEAYLADDHTVEQLLDDIVGPALARARIDHERGALKDHEFAALVRGLRVLLDAVLGDVDVSDDQAPVVLLGLPAHDEADSLWFDLLQRLLVRGTVKVITVGPAATASDVLQMLEDSEGRVVCLTCLPPTGNSRARYLCKRIRAKHPQMPILGCVWGGNDPNGSVAGQLKAAGASNTAGTFAAARSALVPLLQTTSHLEPVAG